MAGVPPPFNPVVVKLEGKPSAPAASRPGMARRFFPKAVKRPEGAAPSQSSSDATPMDVDAEGEVMRNARHDSKWQPREYKSFHQLAFEATAGTGGLAPATQSKDTGTPKVQSKAQDEEGAPPPPLHALREQTRNFPTSLPIGINQADTSDQMNEENTACFFDSGSEELKEDTLFLIQLPALLPLPLDTRSKGKTEDSKSPLAGHPVGQCGKLLVHKSGKIKLKLGNCMMDVSLAKSGTFAQSLMAVNTTDDCCYFLGEVSHTMVVTPSLTELPTLSQAPKAPESSKTVAPVTPAAPTAPAAPPGPTVPVEPTPPTPSPNQPTNTPVPVQS